MGCTCEVLTAVLQLILKYARHIIITFFVSTGMFCQSDSMKKTDGWSYNVLWQTKNTIRPIFFSINKLRFIEF